MYPDFPDPVVDIARRSFPSSMAEIPSVDRSHRTGVTPRDQPAIELNKKFLFEELSGIFVAIYASTTRLWQD
jgi:hypothetical protein